VISLKLECSFTALIDSCHSRAMIEGAKEIIGYSTRYPTISNRRTPKDTRFKLGKPSNCRLGILISACQNRQTNTQKFFKDGTKGWSIYFTQNLLSVIKETKGNVSNMELVEKIASNMAHAFEKYS
jgi:hypothetical protein